MKNAYRVTQKGETSDRLYNPKRSAHNNKSSKHRAQNGTKIWNWQMCKIFGPFNTTILEFEKLSKKPVFKDVEDWTELWNKALQITMTEHTLFPSTNKIQKLGHKIIINEFQKTKTLWHVFFPQ